MYCLTDMITTFSDVPVLDFMNLSPSQQPEMVIRRNTARERWVSVEGSLLDKPLLNLCTAGDLVRVPLMSYVTLAAPERLMAFALELGVRLKALVPEDAAQLHIACGTPTLAETYKGEDAWRIFIGAAFRLKE
jgi:hypothetical protein